MQVKSKRQSYLPLNRFLLHGSMVASIMFPFDRCILFLLISAFPIFVLLYLIYTLLVSIFCRGCIVATSWSVRLLVAA